MKHVTTKFDDWKKNSGKALPSHLQIGDEADLEFGEAGTLKKCIVSEVHFEQDKVWYDFSVPVDKENSVRIEHVDSACVKYRGK